MRANNVFCVLTTADSRSKIWPVKINLSSPMAAVCSKGGDSVVI